MALCGELAEEEAKDMSLDTLENVWMMNTMSLPVFEPLVLLHPAPSNVITREVALS